MKIDRLQAIVSVISKVSNVEIVNDFKTLENCNIKGSVSITADSKAKLQFEVIIGPTYPLRNQDMESITFINKDLISYDHVMGDGSICIHTYHNPNLTEKLIIDFLSIDNWISKYYLAKEVDDNYEHIIVPNNTFKDTQRVFLFTDIEHTFSKGEFGKVEISNLSSGKYRSDIIITSIIQTFKSGSVTHNCTWNSSIKQLGFKDAKAGLFVFTEKAPVINKKFAVQNWLELRPYLGQSFLNELHKVEKELHAQHGMLTCTCHYL